jgi:hypothetical protein
VEIPASDKPGEYPGHGVYSINGLAFLENYE